MEEQKQRRAEIEKLIERVEADQRYGLLITGAIWSWLATTDRSVQYSFGSIVAVLPPVLMLFFWFRWWKLHRTIRDAAIYTIELEKLFGLRLLRSDLGPFGWESWLHPKDGTTRHRASLKWITFTWWLLLFVANVVVAILFTWFGLIVGRRA